MSVFPASERICAPFSFLLFSTLLSDSSHFLSCFAERQFWVSSTSKLAAMQARRFLWEFQPDVVRLHSCFCMFMCGTDGRCKSSRMTQLSCCLLQRPKFDVFIHAQLTSYSSLKSPLRLPTHGSSRFFTFLVHSTSSCHGPQPVSTVVL